MIRALRSVGISTLLMASLIGLGCGTTRMTDTTRSATEQLLVSQAIDNAVSRIDFSPMTGRSVFFEEKCLDGAVDKGYLASSLRQQMLSAGCMLVEDKVKATYVVEARTGCVGTDKNSFMLGIPQMQLPTIVPGTPPAIPEMPIVKSTAQQGVAKVAVFAYNRVTGKAVWQSGTQESVSSSKDAYVLGIGPFHRGTLNKEAESPVNQLDVIGITDSERKTVASVNGQPHATQAMAWQEAPTKGSGLVTVGGKEETGGVKQAGGKQ